MFFCINIFSQDDPLLSFNNAEKLEAMRWQVSLHDLKDNFSYTHKLAELGFAPAQYYLGRQYQIGRFPAGLNLQKSVFWYRRSANLGDPRAQYELGMILKSDYWLYLSSQQGNLDAQKAWAKLVYRQSKIWMLDHPGSTLSWIDLIKAKEKAHQTIAEFQLGLYEQYAQHNLLLAILDYQASAKHGYWPALLKLGFLNNEGQGVREDPYLAAHYFLQAYQLGSDIAFNMLAILKTEGFYQGRLNAQQAYLCARYGLQGCCEFVRKHVN